MSVNTFGKVKILVTGGAGFVGSNLVKQILLSSKDVKIVVVDNLLSSEKINVPDDPRVNFIENSITSDEVLQKIGDAFEYVFHLATYHGNQNSIYDPIADHENNTLTTLKLMNHIKDFKNIKKVVYSAAGCATAVKTFDETKATTEDASISLIQDSPYSISKLIGEFYSVYFYRQHKLPTVRARFQNVYGPGEILGAGKWRGTPATVWRNVTPVFIYKALNSMPLPLENGGKASRDFIYVEDICAGLIACALKGAPGDVYNIASGIETSIFNLASIINEFTGNKAGFEFLPQRAWDHSGRRYGSIGKAEKELGYKARIILKDGLKKTIEWTRNNISVIQSCIDKNREYLKEI